MTFTTPQEHINATDAELRREHGINVLSGCLVAVAMMVALIAVHAAWIGPVQNHIETRLEQDQ